MSNETFKQFMTKGWSWRRKSGGNSGGNGPTEPYIEEIYDANGNLVDAVMHGYTNIRDKAF